jgi:SAM-dependent methyltransferase
VTGPRVQSTGSGAFAPDGSPVEFYLALVPGAEPEMVRTALPKGGSILELGCGVGRITHPLLALGYSVVAVDNSAEMLEHVRGAETFLSDIETLDLGRTFDLVLLASHLINTADRAQRSAFLATCRRHIGVEGNVLIQRTAADRSWSGPGISSDRQIGAIRIRIHDISRVGNVVDSVAEYIDERTARTWIQPFTAELLDDRAFGEALVEADLRLVRWLDEARTWADCVPAAHTGGSG